MELRKLHLFIKYEKKKAMFQKNNWISVGFVCKYIFWLLLNTETFVEV